MKDFILVVSIFALACLAAKTASEPTDADHPTPTSRVNGAIGDYVAAGLGLSTLESTSTLTAETRNDLLETTSSSSHFLTFFNKTSTPTRVATSKHASITVNDITTTSATDCWHSWQDYWTASAYNTPKISVLTLDVTSSKTVIWTRPSFTSWATSSWESAPYTFTFFLGSTIYSENFPVSVVSSWTTDSGLNIGWRTWTERSKLGEYYTTVILPDRNYQDITVGSATALPTPSCELPAIMPECSTEWSSKIFDRLNADAPPCTQVMITGDWCTALRSQYLKPPKFIGANQNVGWETTGSTSYFPVSKTLAPGCTLGCQACSITGESVQLYYWPPTTATLVENGTETATLTPVAQNGSFIRTVSVDGTVLTSPTIYISYDVLHAADSCGAVGKTYRNTILPLSNKDHLFSVERLDPYGSGVRGFFRTSSFNLMDLIEPIPDSIYDRQFRCKESSRDWYGSRIILDQTDNATFSCPRTEPYAPIIEVPPEARALDPAWSSCRAWYGGLFDPPKALKPADASAIPTPIFPSTAESPAATPKTTSGLPTETLAPVTSKPRPQAEQNEDTAEPTPFFGVASNPRPQADQSKDTGDPKPVAPQSKAEEATGVSASASGDASRVGKTRASQLDSSKGVAAILSMLLTQGTNTDVAPQITPASDPESFNDPNMATSVGSEVHTSPAGQGRVDVDDTPLVDGQAIVVDGQTISTMSGAAMASDFPKSRLVLVQAPTPLGVSIVAGQEHTAVEHADGSSQADRESFTVYSASILPDQPNAVLLAGHTLSQGGAPVTIDGHIITYGQNGISVSDSAASVAATVTADHVESVFTIDSTVYTATPVPGRSGVVVLQGHTLSISDSGLIVGDRLVTKGTEGVSIVVAGGTSTSSDDAEFSRPKSTTDVVQSYSSGVQQGSAAPSEPDENSALEYGFGFGLAMMCVPVLLGTLFNL